MNGIATRLGAWLDAAGAARSMQRFHDGWPASASPGVRFHRSPKVQFRYREAGAGRTIVFTADPPMTLETYDALVATFAPHFRVLVVELPAMGFSATTADFGFGWRETNDELTHFLRAVAGPGAIFAFSCVAGLAALDIAARTPELCSHLALIQTGDPAAFAVWKAARDPKRVLAKPILGQVAMKQMAAKRMPAWYKLSVGRPDMIDGFCACAARSFTHGAMWSLASAYQIYMNDGLVLPAPPQPVLSIWGDADRSHPDANRHTLKRIVPNLREASFADLGHTAELEDPARVLAEIQAFLGTAVVPAGVGA